MHPLWFNHFSGVSKSCKKFPTMSLPQQKHIPSTLPLKLRKHVLLDNAHAQNCNLTRNHEAKMLWSFMQAEEKIWWMRMWLCESNTIQTYCPFLLGIQEPSPDQQSQTSSNRQPTTCPVGCHHIFPTNDYKLCKCQPKVGSLSLFSAAKYWDKPSDYGDFTVQHF